MFVMWLQLQNQQRGGNTSDMHSDADNGLQQRLQVMCSPVLVAQLQGHRHVVLNTAVKCLVT